MVVEIIEVSNTMTTIWKAVMGLSSVIFLHDEWTYRWRQTCWTLKSQFGSTLQSSELFHIFWFALLCFEDCLMLRCRFDTLSRFHLELAHGCSASRTYSSRHAHASIGHRVFKRSFSLWSRSLASLHVQEGGERTVGWGSLRGERACVHC